jgi:two-component system sensor histidine kinase RegB
VVQAVRGLLENALHATEGDQEVEFVIRRAEDAVRLEVHDRGVGMTREVLERAAEPFFSTKGPGRGMGLGLFLAQSVAEQLGGRLELEWEPGRGTRASLVLPDLMPATICPMGEAWNPAPS